MLCKFYRIERYSCGFIRSTSPCLGRECVAVVKIYLKVSTNDIFKECEWSFQFQEKCRCIQRAADILMFTNGLSDFHVAARNLMSVVIRKL